MSNNRWAWLGLLICIGLLAPSEPVVPYRFPMEYHRTLAGTFAELRPDHFHGGIDIKTGGQVGAPVYAIADGWVYRIKVSPFGFGNAIYLRHYDGRYSVYAHLETFAPALDAYVRGRQIAERQTEQEIYLGQEEMPVRQGEFIARSGNSGASLGPHLHFEIRNSEDQPLNPLAFYLDMIPDHRVPVVSALALEPLAPHSRVAGQATKVLPALSGKEGMYQTDAVIDLQGPVGIEIDAYDQLDGADNTCGINRMRLLLDEKLIFTYGMETFPFENTRLINYAIDYAWYRRTGQRLLRLYREPGNILAAYTSAGGRGVIELQDDRIHSLRLELMDLHGNQSIVTAQVRRSTSTETGPPPLPGKRPAIRYAVRRGTLVVEASPVSATWLKGLRWQDPAGYDHELPIASTTPTSGVWMLPLDRFVYPVAVTDHQGQALFRFSFVDEVFPDRNNLLELDDIQVFIPYSTVPDRLHLQITRAALPGPASAAYEVGSMSDPVLRPFVVSFRPPPGIDPSTLVVVKRAGSAWSMAGRRLTADGRIYAHVSEFGTYALATDYEQPWIRPVNFVEGKTIDARTQSLVLRAGDDLSGLDRDIVAFYLNGEWIPAMYDYKRDTFTWDMKDQRPLPGPASLEVVLADQCGNTRRVSYKLIF